jgi:hypothetical protein
LEEYYLFEFKRDILALTKNSAAKVLLKNIFPVRFGKRIGRIEEGIFTPDNRIGRDFELTKIPIYEISSEQELDDYLRGKEIGTDQCGEYSILRYQGLNVAIESINIKNGHFSNTFPREWVRR